LQPIGGKKALALCILKILEEYSDVDHPLTHAQIIKKLSDDYGMEAGRNAVRRNILLLCELGYDISTYEENNRGVYLRERAFDEMELLVLIDSVLTSKFIPESDAKRLIKKLGEMSSRYFRQRLPHISRVSEWHHQRNRQFFLNLEVVSEAIEKKQQVAFIYNKPKPDGCLHPVRDVKDQVHPYALVCTNGQYYLIASYKNYDNLLHYRVDRMTEIELLDQEARSVTEIPGYENGLDISRYAAEHNFMYGGKTERIVLKMPCECAGDVLDFFGHTAVMEKIDDQYMRVTLRAAVNGMRFFALQFGCVCEVLEPEELRDLVRNDVKAMLERYEADN
jgi:predicted DNA-binding transcriptional regulator YafY